MTSYNPNIARLLGIEWAGSAAGSVSIETPDRAQGFRFLPVGDELVTGLTIDVDAGSTDGLRYKAGGRVFPPLYIAEIYPITPVGPPVVTTSRYAVSAYSNPLAPSGTWPAAITALQPAPDPVSDTSFILNGGLLRFDTSTFPVMDGVGGDPRQVADLRVAVSARKGRARVTVVPITSAGVVAAEVRPEHTQVLSFGTDFEEKAVSFGEVVPYTMPGKPTGLRPTWANDSVRMFRNLGVGWGVLVQTFDLVTEIGHVVLEVDHWPERRSAAGVGVLVLDASATDRLVIPMYDYTRDGEFPAVVGWQKNSGLYGNDVLVAVRRLRDQGPFQPMRWRYVDGPTGMDNWTGTEQLAYRTGDLGQIVSATPTGKNRAFASRFLTTGNVALADGSQVYSLRKVYDDAKRGLEGFGDPPAFGSFIPPVVIETLHQDVRAGAVAITVAALRLVVRPPAMDDGTVLGLVTFSNSDSTSPVAAAPLSYSDVVESGVRLLDGWWRVQLHLLAPVAVAAATVKTINVTPNPGWSVFALDAVYGIGAPDLTYGAADTIGFRENNGTNRVGDAPWLAVAVLPAPTGVTVTVSTVTFGTVDPTCAEQVVEDIDVATVAWTASGAPSCAGYTVERWDEITGWQTVRCTADPAVTSFVDLEARFGVETRWRVTQADDLGVRSMPSAVVSATLGTGDELAYVFSSTVAGSSRMVAYNDIYEDSDPRRDYKTNAEPVVYDRVFGRSGVSVFRPGDRPTVTFSRTLLTNACAGPEHATLNVWPARVLFDLCHDPLIPYVCVRDGRGGRWFAEVEIPTVSDRPKSGHQFVAVDVIELTDRADVVTDDLLSHFA